MQANVSRKTINYELQVLGTFFRWAVRQNHLLTNPEKRVEKFRLPRKALPKFLTQEELALFFSFCRPDERRLFGTMLLTGMRKGELEHLQWSDISFELGVIFIRPKEDWRPKTDERITPISPVLHAILAEQHRERRSEQWVFANRNGNRDTHLLDKMKRICRKAGIRPGTLHMLRHSFGAHLRMQGVRLADIADLMGHRDLATTQIYAKVQMEHLREAVTRIGPLLSRQTPTRQIPNGTLPGSRGRRTQPHPATKRRRGILDPE